MTGTCRHCGEPIHRDPVTAAAVDPRDVRWLHRGFRRARCRGGESVAAPIESSQGVAQ